MTILAFPAEIFSRYAIDFMRPFTKVKGYDRVLVVIDRAVGFSWLIPTMTTATAVDTIKLLNHNMFTPHGVSTSQDSDTHPCFCNNPTIR